MRILCLCPVYGHPRHLVETAIECFHRQDYPEVSRSLLIYDDLGIMTGVKFESRSVSVASSQARQPSLPAKYNVMARLGEQWADAIAVWEVDDLYMPWHLDAVRLALEHSKWAHPMTAWSTYPNPGCLQIERTGGRFHSALAMRKDGFDAVGGWIETRRPDFDQQLLKKLEAVCGPPGLPDGNNLPPSLCFRWSDTGCTHGQGTMKSPDDETWYDRYEPFSRDRIAELTPRLDGNAERTFNEIMFRAQDWKR